MNSNNSVWIVDDDRSIRWVLEKSLSKTGLITETFESGDELLNRLTYESPDAIISDIRMPGINGLDLLSTIQESHPSLPVIIMTAHSDLDSAVASYSRGAFEYLPKPFDIEDAIAKLVLRDMMEQREEEDDSDKVQLLTLHASKGLEFPHVFIMGLEEEILPHRSSIEEGNVEEERRLMYVGITRARETLALTYAASRKQYGEKLETIPSRFLDELPEDDVKWEGLGESDQQANQKKGKATLSALIGDLGL